MPAINISGSLKFILIVNTKQAIELRLQIQLFFFFYFAIHQANGREKNWNKFKPIVVITNTLNAKCVSVSLGLALIFALSLYPFHVSCCGL